MSQITFSFAVGSAFGPRSYEWIVTADDYDTYITNTAWKRDWKATLHKSGRWHIKSLKNTTIAPLVKSERGASDDPSHSPGIFIVIPDSCLRKASEPEKILEPWLWLDRPEYGGVVEIAISDWYFSKSSKYPGQDVGTVMRAIVRTSADRALVLVTRHLAPQDPVAQSYLTQIEDMANPKPIALDSPERRGLCFSQTVAGSLLVTEFAID